MNVVSIEDNAPSRRAIRVPSVRAKAATFVYGLLFTAAMVSQSLAADGGNSAAVGTTSPSGGLGSQLNAMSGEVLNSGSNAFGVGCYVAATICFFWGAWALWQSRQPQNRETGYIGRGIAGMVLCGLFATSGVWINKAAVSASGNTATINDTVSMVQFGSGTSTSTGG